MRLTALIAAIVILGAIPTGKMPDLTLSMLELLLGLVAWGALLTGVGVIIVRGRQ